MAIDNKKSVKTAYVTQVENKYVFNLSLIFWHIFIALSTIVIVASIAVFLWSLIPASQKDVDKQPYPEPVKVALNELNLEVVKEDTPNISDSEVQTPIVAARQQVEDINGKAEYEISLNTLKTLIPPSKYSWQGSGFWTYPYGERYWTVYKQEQYRHWNSTVPGIEEKLNYAYQRTNARDYSNKKTFLDGYIAVLKQVPEEKRLEVLEYLVNNVANNISQNVNICQSLTSVIEKMPKDGSMAYLNQLARLGKNNPDDGYLFINYTGSIIDKFDASKRSGIIDQLVSGYYNYFNRNLVMLREATDLFLPLVPQINASNQVNAIIQYYGVFRSKNFVRDNTIAQIDNKYLLDQITAQQEYSAAKSEKTDYRIKSLVGIGAGIAVIVLIAVVLVFFSIQRSVKKIEDRILMAD